MRLAIVTAFPREPTAPHGGVEAVSVNLVRALAKRPDLEVHVVTSDPHCQHNETAVWAGATVHRLSASRGSLLSYVVGPGRRQVQDYLRVLRPDVVHAHDFYGIMVKGLLLPRVFTVHGFIHEDTLYSGQRLAWLRSRLWRFFETAAWADQPHIVSISPYVRERLRGVCRGVIHDIENPVSEELFQTVRTPDRQMLFSAALICPRKNTLGMLRVMEHLIRRGNRAHLRLAGRVIDAAYQRKVDAFILGSALADHVSLLGAIEVGRVRQELASAAAFVLLSFEEGVFHGHCRSHERRRACGHFKPLRDALHGSKR